MPRPTIAEIRSITDFQKPYMWELSFLRLPNFVEVNPFRVNLQCLSAEVPKKTGQTATLLMRGHQIFDPGIYNVQGTMQLTFVETIDNQVRNLIQQWEDACANKTGTFTQLTGDLRLVTMNNQEEPNYEYWLLWAFLEDSNINPLDGGTSDPMQPTITLRYTDYQAQQLT